MFDMFTAVYANDDKFLQFFFLHSRILENVTPEQVRMDEGAYIECFNFLNFFVGGDLAEMDARNVSDHHFAPRTVDPGVMDEPVDALWADSTIN